MQRGGLGLKFSKKKKRAGKKKDTTCGELREMRKKNRGGVWWDLKRFTHGLFFESHLSLFPPPPQSVR